jgi:hypothetical protein
MISQYNRVPQVHFWLYAVANVVLNVLNVWWFSKMVAMVQRKVLGKLDVSVRTDKPATGKARENAERNVSADQKEE